MIGRDRQKIGSRSFRAAQLHRLAGLGASHSDKPISIVHPRKVRTMKLLRSTAMKQNTRLLALAASCAAVALFAGAPAFSGEVNGRGDPIPATDHAASVCAF